MHVLVEHEKRRPTVLEHRRASNHSHTGLGGIAMAELDDTLQALNRLERTINEQRDLLLQAHGVLACVQDVLLHAGGEEAISCAQATQVAANLIDKSAEEL